MNDKVNTVVIGKLIKEELQRQGKTSVWLANELGCHRTNIYKVYDRTTIDTGMLFHISKILKVDFFKYYSDALSSNNMFVRFFIYLTIKINLHKFHAFFSIMC